MNTRPGFASLALTSLLLIPMTALAAAPTLPPALAGQPITIAGVPAGAPPGAEPLATARAALPFRALAGPVSTDGVWSEQFLLPASLHGAVLDPSRNRMLVLRYEGEAAGTGRRNLWALPLTGAPEWQRIEVSAPLDPPLTNLRTAVYDPVRDRILVYEPYGSTGSEIWTLPLGSLTWQRLDVAGPAPSARSYPALVYDPLGDRLLLDGGAEMGNPTATLNETWSLNLSGAPAWSSITTSAPMPPGRAMHSAVFDVANDRMLVYGGWFDQRTLWALSLAGTPEWSMLADASDLNAPTAMSVLAGDAAHSRVLAFDAAAQAVLAFPTDRSGTWGRLADMPGPNVAGFSAVSDPARDRIIVHGGQLAYGSYAVRSDTRALSLAGEPAWTTLIAQPFEPDPRSFAAGALDTRRGRLLVHSGYYPNTGYGDVWALALGSNLEWSPLPTAGPSAGTRWWHEGVYDAARDRMIVFGGVTDLSYAGHSDVWQLSFTTTPATWSQIVPTGTPPAPRFATTLVYDSIRDRLIVYGGFDSPGNVFHGDLWELSLGGTPAWRRMTPAAGPVPAARCNLAAAFDPVRNRVVYFGGTAAGQEWLDETWALDLSSGDGRWIRLAAGTTAPNGRVSTRMQYDPIRDRMLIHGGYGFDHVDAFGNIYISYLNDTWALALGGTEAWTRLESGGAIPRARDRYVSAFDAEHDRLVVTTGMFQGSSDTWTLDFIDLATPVAASLISAQALPDRVTLAWQGSDAAGATARIERRTATSAWTAIGSVVADGQQRFQFVDVNVAAGERYGYRLAVTTAGADRVFGETWVNVPSVPLALAIAPVRNPVDGDLVLQLTLPASAPVHAEVLDVSGRRVVERDLGALEAGQRAVRVAGRGEIAAGFYLVRVRQADRTALARMLVVR